MDVRKNALDTLVFADNDGGSAKAVKLTCQVPCQFRIENASGEYLIIRREDLNNLRTALDYAETLWRA
jgi:hypothetical protein